MAQLLHRIDKRQPESHVQARKARWLQTAMEATPPTPLEIGILSKKGKFSSATAVEEAVELPEREGCYEVPRGVKVGFQKRKEETPQEFHRRNDPRKEERAAAVAAHRESYKTGEAVQEPLKPNRRKEAAWRAADERILEQGPWISGIQFRHRKEVGYREKIASICSTMERTPNGQLPPTEVRILFTRLLGVPALSLEDANDEVVAFAGLCGLIIAHMSIYGNNHSLITTRWWLSRACQPRRRLIP